MKAKKLISVLLALMLLLSAIPAVSAAETVEQSPEAAVSAEALPEQEEVTEAAPREETPAESAPSAAASGVKIPAVTPGGLKAGTVPNPTNPNGNIELMEEQGGFNITTGKYEATAPVLSSVSEAVEYLRGQMKLRKAEVQFYLPWDVVLSYPSTDAILNDMYQQCIEHNGVPDEGDYLWLHINGYTLGLPENDTKNQTSLIVYTFDWRSTGYQEEQVTQKMKTLIPQLGLHDSTKTDYEKIKAIYDYICSHVTYDFAHLSDRDYQAQYTAYSALIRENCVCMGYSLLFYRMALEAGVDCRYIGSTDEGDHAWDIVQLNGLYYNLDSTWDRWESSGGNYTWFLLNNANFTDEHHYRHPKWFEYPEYPMASNNYNVSNPELLPAPKLLSISNTVEGITLTWTPNSWIKKYRVVAKVNGGSEWYNLGDVTAPDHCIWTAAESGTTYTLSVFGVTESGKEFTSKFDSNGLTITRFVTPQITSLTNTDAGIKISWTPVTGASKYTVFCKTGSGSWQSIYATTATTYTWPDAKSGTKYTFMVRPKDANGNFVGAIDNTGKSITYEFTPKISSVSSTTTGIKITWPKMTGASKYTLFYKTGTGSWQTLYTTSSTSYTWTGAKSGTKYTFMVRPKDSAGKIFGKMDNTGKSITYYATPKISSVTATTSGIKISWGKVAGASKYTVFYKTGSGSWQSAYATSATSYTWPDAKSGTKYTFMVRPKNSAGSFVGAIDQTGKSITYYATPKISSLTNTGSGIKIVWGAVGGASKYTVFYKTGTGSWKSLYSTSSTSYTWTGAKSGTKYTFMVRPKNSAGSFIGAIDQTGKSITYTVTPKLSSVKTTIDGIQITWAKISGASKYSLFYKTGSGSWQSLASSTTTSYTWKNAKSGTKYTFMVRPRDSAGKLFGSIDDTGMSVTYYATPKISSVTATADGIKISWNKVAGASKYTVFYKTGSGSWQSAYATSSTSYTWPDAKSGTKYTFMVRPKNSAGSFVGAIDNTGKSITYYATPKISSLTNTSSGIKITWGAVTGASKYTVFYKTGTGSWKSLYSTSSTSYTWSGAKNGTKYTFMVRGKNSAGSFIGAIDQTGRSITAQK